MHKETPKHLRAKVRFQLQLCTIGVLRTNREDSVADPIQAVKKNQRSQKVRELAHG